MLRITPLFISSIVFFFSSFSLAGFVNAPDSQVLTQISPGTSDILPTSFQLLVWNVKKGDYKPAWPSDFQTLASPRSLVLVQEAMENDFMLQVFQGVPGFGWMMARSFYMDTDRNATGVATGSPAQPLETRFLRSPDLEPVVNTPKMVILTTYRLASGASLLAINIHAINVNAPTAFFRQIDQISEVIRTWNDKILFAGDFNTWEPIRLNYLVMKMSQNGLKHVRFSPDNRPQVLDHIFLRGCVTLNSQIRSDITSSDHSPMTAEISCEN